MKYYYALLNVCRQLVFNSNESMISMKEMYSHYSFIFVHTFAGDLSIMQ